MTTVRLYKTNNVDDPGVELETTEIARRFWASTEAQEWLTTQSGRLERLALSWVPTEIGTWLEREDWEPIFDAIFAARPYAGDSDRRD